MRNHVLLVSLLGVIFLMISISPSFSQSYGRLRILKERAVVVTQMKNRFVTRVLDTYHIPYECNSDGVVFRMKVEDRWNIVRNIEIVPIMNDKASWLQVTAHDIFFDTDGGMFHLVSQLIIR